MNLIKSVIFTMLGAALLLNTSCSQSAKKDEKSPVEWGVKMADSDMARFPDASMLDWTPTPKWSYTQGLVTLALQRLADATGDQKYYDYGFAYADKMIKEDGSIDTYKMDKYNLDLVNSGKILFEIYAKTGEERFKNAMDTLNLQLENQPRTSDGGYWHKKVYTNQMWLDGVYMADPFHAQYGKVFNKPEALEDAMHQVFTVQIV